MIKTIDLVKTFDGFTALDGASLHVEKGSVYGLVGPNGAGKSTLIRHLVGVYKQDSGEVLIDGQPVYENPEIKKRIAYIPDDLYRYGADTINDMMKLYRGIYTDFNMERYEKLKGVFEVVNTKKPIRKMSKGMQKQVAFWLAICCNPDVMILDEPVDGLDPVMRRQVWSLMMADVAERGTTVLVSSHNLRELEDVCDTVGIMNKGKILLERSLSSLQGNITKLQVAFPDDFDFTEFEKEFEIINNSKLGSIYTAVVRGSQEEVRNRVAKFNPLIVDALPLTLEEIFIYEMGGVQYEIKDLVL